MTHPTRRDLFALPAAALFSSCLSSRPSRVVDAIDDGRAVTFGVGQDLLARYHHEPPDPPAGVDALHARSGYIHPLWTPSGQVVTGDFPASHRHQHGVFFAWTRTRFEGREVDFWNTGAGQGRVECAAFSPTGGPVVGELRAMHHHTDLTAPGGPKLALVEQWELRVHGQRSPHVLDLVSMQECAGDRPLEVLEYHYGGLAFRGPEAWEGRAATFLTSEREDRAAGDGSRVRWCAASGPSPELATLAILCHPDNLRAPHPVRIHPSNPYFCFSPCRLGAFSIAPGRPLTSRYRLIAMDGPADADELDGMWNDYADPVRVRATEPVSCPRPTVP